MIAKKIVTEKREENRVRWLLHFSFGKDRGNRKTITPLHPNPSMAKEMDMKTKWKYMVAEKIRVKRISHERVATATKKTPQ
jgi:hypothetical protein